MPQKFVRLGEAQGLIGHGLGENANAHEEYIGAFREMVRNVERMYDRWLLDTGRRQPHNSDRANSGPDTLSQPPALEPFAEL